jgi:hypothetical protein
VRILMNETLPIFGQRHSLPGRFSRLAVCAIL